MAFSIQDQPCKKPLPAFAKSLKTTVGKDFLFFGFKGEHRNEDDGCIGGKAGRSGARPECIRI